MEEYVFPSFVTTSLYRLKTEPGARLPGGRPSAVAISLLLTSSVVAPENGTFLMSFHSALVKRIGGRSIDIHAFHLAAHRVHNDIYFCVGI